MKIFFLSNIQRTIWKKKDWNDFYIINIKHEEEYRHKYYNLLDEFGDGE